MGENTQLKVPSWFLVDCCWPLCCFNSEKKRSLACSPKLCLKESEKNKHAGEVQFVCLYMCVCVYWHTSPCTQALSKNEKAKGKSVPPSPCTLPFFSLSVPFPLIAQTSRTRPQWADVPYPAAAADWGNWRGWVSSGAHGGVRVCRSCLPQHLFLATCCGAVPHVASSVAADPSCKAAWTARCCARGSVLEESGGTVSKEEINQDLYGTQIMKTYNNRLIIL